jgi:phage terminase small subunit
VLEGKTPAQAARDAGYSESYARVDVYRTLANPSIVEKVKARIAESGVHANEVIGTLASQMRADLADIDPNDPLLKRAKKAGVSHLIKRLKTTTRYVPAGKGKKPIKEVKQELELYSAQEAAKQLAAIKGLLKEPGKNPETAAREAYERLRQDFSDIPDETIRQRVSEQFGVEESVLIH